jgi:predicted nucleotidyltransferase
VFEKLQESLLTTSSTPTSQEVLSLLRQHGPLLRERYGVTSLRVFGSIARGTATPASDLDLLVRFDVPATARRFYGLLIFLEDLLGRHVDLVTEKALREEFRQRADADAIAI